MNLTLLDKNERKSIKIVQHQANKKQKEIELEGEREKPKSIFFNFQSYSSLSLYPIFLPHLPPTPHSMQRCAAGKAWIWEQVLFHNFLPVCLVKWLRWSESHYVRFINEEINPRAGLWRKWTVPSMTPHHRFWRWCCQVLIAIPSSFQVAADIMFYTQLLVGHGC